MRIVIFFAVVVVLLILLIFYASRVNSAKIENFISGVWVGDSTFLEKSSLRDIQLFIAPGDSTRNGYLIMTDLDGNFVSNQAVSLSLPSINGCKTMFTTKNDENTIRGVEVEYDVTPVMPSNLNIKLSVLNGTMTFHDDDKIYAFLVKDIAMSLVGIEAYNDRE